LAYGHLEEYDKATADYTEAIRLKPDDAKAYNNRGVAYRQLDNDMKAEADYLFYCKPNMANQDMANHHASGQFGKIRIGDVVWTVTCDHKKLILVNRLKVDHLCSQEEAEKKMDNTNLYEADFHIITESPDSNLWIDISNVALDLRFDGVVDRLPMGFSGRNMQSMRKLAIPSIQLLEEKWQSGLAFERGQTLSEYEEYKLAIVEFSEAIRLDAENEVAFNNRGVAYNELSQYDKAIADCTEAIRIDPDLAKAYYNRGVAHRELGNDVKADADFAKADELGVDP